jgi:ketosteroid isomerase-like protein
MFKSRLHPTVLVLATSLVSGSVQMMGQDAGISSKLIALHDKWFKAFDNNDSDTMNTIETTNITLVMSNGYILKNFAPRKKGDVAGSGKDTYFHPEIKRTLSSVSVRQFGDSALLVGILTAESPKEKSQSAETVSFVKVSGEWKIASAQWTDLAKPQ